MIPRVFHRIWLGGQPMPDLFVQWGQSWLDLNPDWTMTTWTEKNLPPSAHPDAVSRACHLSQRSNVYRYEVLARQGGVYLDCDFQALRPLGDLLEGLGVAVAAKSRTRVGCGFIACAAGHPLALDLVRRTPERDPSQSMSLGSSYLRHVMASHPGVTVFAPELFHCVQHYESRKLWRDGAPISADEIRALYPAAIAAHYWADKWFAPSFAQIVNATMEQAA